MNGGDLSRKMNLVSMDSGSPPPSTTRPLQIRGIRTTHSAGDIRQRHSRRLSVNWNRRKVCSVEQVIRPTGLLDPEIEVRSTHLEPETDDHDGKRYASGKRTTRGFLYHPHQRNGRGTFDRHLPQKWGINSAYIHSDVDTLEKNAHSR